MSASVELHEEALAEADAAAKWYAERDLDVADAFADELERAYATIADAPQRWPVELGIARRYILGQFPFKVVYVIHAGRCVVLAVAHKRRSPGYWRHRE